jgi:hypothetical protein
MDLISEQNKLKSVVVIIAGIYAAPQLKPVDARFPLRRPGFAPGSGQVGFVVDKVALE